MMRTTTALLTALFTIGAHAMELHVASNGTTRASGTVHDPLTFEAAVEHVSGHLKQEGVCPMEG